MRPLLRVRATVTSAPSRCPVRRPTARTLYPSIRRSNADNTDSKEPSPFVGFYEDLLDAPLHSVQPGTRTLPASPSTKPAPETEEEERLTKARVVFGSRLAGPVERGKEIAAQSQEVAGVMVPPRPEEPDNCCMSGCVNCVWDLYRDELEEWAAKSAEAKKMLMAQKGTDESAPGSLPEGASKPAQTAMSMDDDGGGSEANWAGTQSSGPDDGEDLFADIPVGIREFMKAEKRLKEKRNTERSSAAG